MCQFLLYTKVIQLYIYIHSFSHIIFHHGLSQEIEYSSLCSTTGPHCLSIEQLLAAIADLSYIFSGSKAALQTLATKVIDVPFSLVLRNVIFVTGGTPVIAQLMGAPRSQLFKSSRAVRFSSSDHFSILKRF